MVQPPSPVQQDAAAAGGQASPNHCLELRTVQAVAFKVLVEALKDLLTDTCIEFDASGMRVVTMDTSHVVLVHLQLGAPRFELYHCPGRLCIGVNMLNLHKLIKTINNSDTLTLFVDSADMNHLCIKIENSEKNSRTTYKLNLLDLDHHNITVDPTDFAGVVTLPCTDFQKICRDMNNLADHMEIKSIGNQLMFSCRGDFCCQETVICDPATSVPGGAEAGAGAPEVDPSGDIVQGVFSLKHLVMFTKCTNLCQTMELYLKNDYPLIVKYDVSSLGSIRLALAPQSASA